MQLRDNVAFVVGQYLRLDPVDAQTPAGGLGGDAVVTGEHDKLDAVFAQCGQRGRGVLSDGVGDGEDAGGVIVDTDVDDGRTIGAQPVGLSVQGGGVDVVRGEEVGAAQHDGVVLDGGLHAAADG